MTLKDEYDHPLPAEIENALVEAQRSIPADLRKKSATQPSPESSKDALSGDEAVEEHEGAENAHSEDLSETSDECTFWKTISEVIQCSPTQSGFEFLNFQAHTRRANLHLLHMHNPTFTHQAQEKFEADSRNQHDLHPGKTLQAIRQVFDNFTERQWGRGHFETEGARSKFLEDVCDRLVLLETPARCVTDHLEQYWHALPVRHSDMTEAAAQDTTDNPTTGQDDPEKQYAGRKKKREEAARSRNRRALNLEHDFVFTSRFEDSWKEHDRKRLAPAPNLLDSKV